jgi:hypothetical protein
VAMRRAEGKVNKRLVKLQTAIEDWITELERDLFYLDKGKPPPSGARVDAELGRSDLERAKRMLDTVRGILAEEQPPVKKRDDLS